LKKSRLIPLIFLFIFVLLPFFFPSVKGATIDLVYAKEDTLYPTFAQWYYLGRRAYQDFQNYSEGALPFYSTGGSTVIQGIYSLNSTFLKAYVLNSTTAMGFNDEKCFFMYPPTTSSAAYTYFPVMNTNDNTTDLHFSFLLCQIINTSLMSGVDEYVYVRINGVNYFLLRLSPYTNATSIYQKIEAYSGGWATKGYIKYQNTSSSTIRYVREFIGVRVLATTTLTYTVQVDEMVNLESTSNVFVSNGLITGAWTGESFTSASMAFRMTSIRGVSLLITALSSNRWQTYATFDNPYGIMAYVVKSFQAYTDSSFFTITIPDPTIYEDDAYYSDIQVKSVLPINNFSQFYCQVTGENNVSETLLNINSYTSISKSVYGNNTRILSFNVLYKTESGNSFNNTIYIKVTRVYTPYSPTFMDLMMLAFPTILMLIIPPGIAAIKFKRNGFLIVFSFMTIILTVTGGLPLFVGLLMLGILAVIFIKLMQQSKEEEE